MLHQRSSRRPNGGSGRGGPVAGRGDFAVGGAFIAILSLLTIRTLSRGSNGVVLAISRVRTLRGTLGRRGITHSAVGGIRRTLSNVSSAIGAFSNILAGIGTLGVILSGIPKRRPTSPTARAANSSLRRITGSPMGTCIGRRVWPFCAAGCRFR